MIEKPNTIEENQALENKNEAETLVYKTQQEQRADETIGNIGKERIDLAFGSFEANRNHYKETGSVTGDEAGELSSQLKTNQESVAAEQELALQQQNKETNGKLHTVAEQIDVLAGFSTVEDEQGVSGDNVLDYTDTKRSIIPDSFLVSGNTESVNETYQEAA